jgi:S-layer protein
LDSAGTQAFVGGTGQDIVTVGASQTGAVSFGTGHNSLIEAAGGNVAVTFGSHGSVVNDNVTAGAATSGTIVPSAVITGMNVAGADTIVFSCDAGATGAISIYSVTQSDTLAQAVAYVLSAGGGNLGQHSVGEFVLQNNTYFVEQAGPPGSAFAAGDTVVELTGLHTFTTATTASAGVLHLHG